ncbi:MAG: hypothetical protein GX568_00960 [Candidatus Gastranaerophilales bacterium]|nr:hypothetical protein [Spirochaetales bacterium]NLF82540.1 hypothetical protein [Candidatus Gastranaerophilales bacterium]
MNKIIETLVKLRDEDETEWLETRKEIFEYYLQSSPVGKKDLLFEELNQISKEIEESINKQKSGY